LYWRDIEKLKTGIVKIYRDPFGYYKLCPSEINIRMILGLLLPG